jgi:hypothetical protein
MFTKMLAHSVAADAETAARLGPSVTLHVRDDAGG